MVRVQVYLTFTFSLFKALFAEILPNHALAILKPLNSIRLKSSLSSDDILQSNSSQSGTSGYRYSVYAMCDNPPQNYINGTCTDGVIHGSCCQIDSGFYQKCVCSFINHGPFTYPNCFWSEFLLDCGEIVNPAMTSTEQSSTDWEITSQLVPTTMDYDLINVTEFCMVHRDKR